MEIRFSEDKFLNVGRLIFSITAMPYGIAIKILNTSYKDFTISNINFE